MKLRILIENCMIKKKAYHDVYVEPVDDKTERGLAFETQISKIRGGHRMLDHNNFFFKCKN